MESIGKDPEVVKETTAAAFNRPAPRPHYSVLGHLALERIGVEPETISRFERGATTPSLQTLEKNSPCLRVRIGELLAETSAQPDDQATKIAAWLAELDEPHRSFVVDIGKRTCDHLRSA